MSGTKFQTILVVSMVVVVLAGASMADDDCYSKCKSDCRDKLKLPNFICQIRCRLHCIVPPSSSTTTTSMTTAMNDGLDFCNLGCASLKCANLIDYEKPSKERVEGCLNSCSAVCVKNYMA